MKKLNIILLTAVLGITGCATNPQFTQPAQVATSTSYGKVINVREYSLQRSDNNLGAVALGGVVGGLLGNQVGGGRGKKLATAAGVGVGAYTANEMSKQTSVVPMVELSIQDESGVAYKIDQEKNANFYMGQRVRVNFQGNVATVTPY